MSEPYRCDHCGALLAAQRENVIPLRTARAGPPQVEVTEVNEDRMRLRINLVVPREIALRILSLLGAAD